MMGKSESEVRASLGIFRIQAPKLGLSSTLSALCEIAEKHGDWATNDYATSRVQEHDKFAWMLRAHLRTHPEGEATV